MITIVSIGRTLRVLRAVRWIQAVSFLFAAADLVYFLLEGRAALAVVAAVFVVFWSLMLCVQTKLIHLREAELRPRADYDAIDRMEREVYGQPFKHEGAPEQRCDGCRTPLGTRPRYHDTAGRHYCEACERKRRRN